MNLAETLAAFPGGLAALAELDGVSYTNLRRFRDGGFVNTPWDLARRIASPDGAWRDVPGMGSGKAQRLAKLVELYQEARTAATTAKPKRRRGRS